MAGVLLLFLYSPHRDARPLHQTPAPFATERGSPNSEILPPEGVRSTGGDARVPNALMPPRLPSDSYKAGPGDSANLFREPRIAYSSELSLVTKEFAHSRSSLEEILERHHGYVAKLRMVGQPSASVLSATLRVPSSEYRSALTELKAVGVVEHEEEAADEITQQHSELEARLVNAQNEEHRILQLLQNRTEKANDSGTLERQVSLLRSEIDRMETERYASGSRESPIPPNFLLSQRSSPIRAPAWKRFSIAIAAMWQSCEWWASRRAVSFPRRCASLLRNIVPLSRS